MWEELQFELTGYDTRTLKPHLLETLGIKEKRPEIKLDELVRETEGYVLGYTDGSFDNKEQSGAYAVAIERKDRSWVFNQVRLENAVSSFEPELRAIWDLLRAAPLETNIGVVTDSLSAIEKLLKRAQYTDKPKEKIARYEEILVKIEGEIRKRQEHGYETKFFFVHSHLLDKQKEEETKEERETKEKKLQKMKERYKGAYERLLRGNKEADELAENCAAAFGKRVQTAAVREDPAYVIRIGKRTILDNAMKHFNTLR